MRMKKFLVAVLLFLLPFSIAFAEGTADPTVFSMTYPVEEVIVTSPFGWRIHPITGDAKFNSGTDFGYDYGRYIHASANGIVTYSGWISGYGNTVILSHGGAYETLYGHNQEARRGFQ